MPNSEQREYWNSDAGQNWVAQADELDAMLADVARAVLTRAEIQRDQSVLDVGCGSGALTLMAQESVGDKEAVTGIDISAPLIDLAKRRAAAAKLPTYFALADAAIWQSDKRYDVIISRFGVMFFDNPTAAFANILQSIKPNGRLVFSCWRDPKENDMGSGLMKAVAHLFTPPAVKPDPKAPGPYAFSDQDHVGEILHGAGWRNVQFEKWDGFLPLTKTTARENAEAFTQIGSVSRLLREQNVAIDRVIDALATFVESRKKSDGRYALSGAVWIVSATR